MKTAPTLAARHGVPVVGAARTERDASTRRQVAASILTHGPSTAASLAERLSLTAAAIRRHLDLLEEQGLVDAREQRVYGPRGRGRPAKVFALTDAGRATFYTAYDDLAIGALDFLRRTAGSAAVEAFAEERIAATEARYARAVSEAEPGVTPAGALATALSADGYAASSQPAGAGEQLCQHHCPVAHVAAEFPELCEAETAAFSRVLGVHVQRLATIAHGDGVCTTHIPNPRPSPSSGHSPDPQLTQHPATHERSDS